MTHTERVQVLVSEYLDTGDSYPLIVAKPDQKMQDRLDAADAKARGRRFDDAAKVSAFAELES